MNLEQVKAYLAENPGALARLGHTDIGVAIKKGRLTPEAAAYLLQITGEDEDSRYYLCRHMKMSFKEGVDSGFFLEAARNDMLDEAWECVTGTVFESPEDLVSFVKDRFNFDLSKDDFDYKEFTDKENLSAFLRLFFYTSSGHAFYADPDYRGVYQKSIEYILRLYKAFYDIDHYCLERCGSISMEDALLRVGNEFWAADFDILIELLEKHMTLNSNKAVVILQVFGRVLEGGIRKHFPTNSYRGILTHILPKLKEYMGSRNYPTPDGGNYDFRHGARNFFQSFFHSINRDKTWEKSDYPQLHDLLNSFMLNENFRKECMVNYYICLPFLKAFLRTGAGRVDTNELFQKMMYFHALHGREAFRVVVSNRESTINPTDEIVESFIDAGMDWENMVYNLDRIYDWNYIRELISKLGTKGALTGDDRWGNNEFYKTRVEVSKLPRQFFELEGLNWNHISSCERMSAEFIHDYWEQINFRCVPNVVGKVIDIELAEKMIAARKVPYPECRVDIDGLRRLLRKATNLPLEYMMENFEDFFETNVYRRVKIGELDIKLVDLVKVLK